MSSYSVSLPLDGGFLRRECPTCERQLKWHDGPTDDRPAGADEPPVYFCPYCGETGLPDEWWTPAQLDYMEQAVMGPAMGEIVDEFTKALGDQRNSMIQVSMSYDEPEPPVTLQEPSDMVEVQSPCHPWEPFKVDEDWTGSLHCLICGQPFAV